MHKKTLTILLGFTFLISGCFFPVRTTRVIGSGNVIEQTRQVSGFSAIELTGVGTLKIVQGDKESLVITAEDNIIQYLRSEVRGNKLVLGVDDFVSFDPRKEIIYTLEVTRLDRIETSGLGSIEVAQLESDDFNLDISGSGNVEILDLQAEYFSLDVSGLGNIIIAGKVEEQRVDLSGAGNYDAAALYSEDARIEISGTGQAVVWVINTLDVELSGMGALEYYGNPTLTTDMSGAGKIESLGQK